MRRIPGLSQAEFLKDRVEVNAFVALSGGQEALLHRLGFQQIRGFALRRDLAPQVYGHKDCGRLPGFVRNDLDVRFRHDFSLLREESQQQIPRGPSLPGSGCSG